LAMLLCLLSLARGNKIYSAAIWAGVAIAFKYIAVPILIPVYWCAFQTANKKDWIKKIIQATLICGLVYAVLNPFSIFDFSFFIKEMREQAAAESHAPFLHHLFYSLGEGVGLPLALIGFCSLFFYFIVDDKKRWLFSYPIAYYFMCAFFSQRYERYILPVLPFVCLGAVLGVNAISAKFFKQKEKAVYLALLCLLGALPLAKSIYLNELLLKPDTRQLAKEWIESNIPEETGLLIDHSFFSPKLSQTRAQIKEKEALIDSSDPHKASKLKKLQLLEKAGIGKKKYRVFYLDQDGQGESKFLLLSPLIKPDPLAIEGAGVEYYVRSRFPGERLFFESQMKEKAELVRVFSPYKDPKKIFTEDEWSNVALPFRSSELFSRKFQGPYLEIYKLRKRS
jgi:hypothetical protein